MADFYHFIVLPTRPQTDTIIAIFLLKRFGAKKYPGIDTARIEVLNTLPSDENWETMDMRGIFCIDIGGGPFDHHKTGKTATQLAAEDLGIIEDPGLGKLLQYADRDDKFGLGTISTDTLDRAFGFAGFIAIMNRVHKTDPQKVVETFLPILSAHYDEEKKRVDEIPKEFEKLLEEKKAEVIEIRHKDKNIKAVIIESDNISLPGWIRSSVGVKADVVAQKVASGHMNIVTKQIRKIDLRNLAARIRMEELKARGKPVKGSVQEYMKQGRMNEIPNWYYDRATNSLLNGGTSPRGTDPTKIDLSTIKTALIDALGAPIPNGART